MLSTRDVEEVHMIPGAPAATEALHRSKCLCLHCCHQGLWQALAFGTPDVPPLAFFLPFWSDFFASHHQIVSARRLSLYHMFCLKNPNCYLLLGVIYIYIYYTYQRLAGNHSLVTKGTIHLLRILPICDMQVGYCAPNS